MRRHLLGILALACFITGIVLWLMPQSDATSLAVSGSTVRIGVVLLAVWLSWPHLERIPRWIYNSVLIFALVVAIRPKLFFLAIPALFIYWLCKPWKPRPKE